MLRLCILTKTTYVLPNDWFSFAQLTASYTTTIVQDIDGATRAAIARVSNIIRVLAAYFVPMTDVILVEAYEWVVEQNCSVKDLLREDVAEALIAAVTT